MSGCDSALPKRTPFARSPVRSIASEYARSRSRQPGVPEGRIVAVAASDEASRLLSEQAVEALRGIGAQDDLRDRFRWGHAIIGVQGATECTALEAMDWMRPVAVVAGEGATEPGLAAAFAEISFRATTSE